MAFYERNGLTILHGDCAELLAGLPPVDLVLTDPPYGLGENRRNASRDKPAFGRPVCYDRAHRGAVDDSSAPAAGVLAAIVSASPKAIVWGGNHLDLPTGETGWLVWDKDNGNSHYSDCELAWTNLGGGVRKRRYRWNGMIQEHVGKHRESRVHPTQKPVPVMTWCLELAKLPVGATVLDPFMGSGTTLVAARAMGLRAIGIDREEWCCAAAVDRLRQGVLFG